MSDDTKDLLELEYYLNNLLGTLKRMGPGWDQATENIEEVLQDVRNELTLTTT